MAMRRIVINAVLHHIAACMFCVRANKWSFRSFVGCCWLTQIHVADIVFYLKGPRFFQSKFYQFAIVLWIGR